MLEAENSLTTARLLLSGVRCRLFEIRKDLDSLIISPELQAVKDKVSSLEETVVSAEAFIGGTAQLIRDNADNKAALLSLADQLDADKTGLANAITTAQGDPNAGNAGGGAPGA